MVQKKHAARSRLIGIGSILFFFALVTAIVIGAAIVLGVTTRPRIIGWPILVLSVGVGIWRMDYWARVLPGILGCAALNGLIITIGGHALNQPSVPIDRLMASLATLAVGVSAFLATTFSDRHLTIIDRVAGVGILASFAVAFSASRLQVLGLIGIVVCVTVDWGMARRHHAIHTAGHSV